MRRLRALTCTNLNDRPRQHLKSAVQTCRNTQCQAAVEKSSHLKNPRSPNPLICSPRHDLRSTVKRSQSITKSLKDTEISIHCNDQRIRVRLTFSHPPDKIHAAQTHRSNTAQKLHDEISFHPKNLQRKQAPACIEPRQFKEDPREPERRV